MVEESDGARWTLLERVDVALAHRWSCGTAEDAAVEAAQQFASFEPEGHQKTRWIRGVLGLRGIAVSTDDVDRILRGAVGRFHPHHQEHKLVTRLDLVLDAVIARTAAGRPPDGWHLVELFRRWTEGLERFRNNTLRKDQPWDALHGVDYPDPDDLSDCLDAFADADDYGENPRVWRALHPVRRAFRVTWRFARIAPFPDLNLPMAFVAGCAYLLARGYPLLFPEPSDRPVWMRIVQDRLPTRIARFEARLCEAAERGA